jgi:hypothetical protein
MSNFENNLLNIVQKYSDSFNGKTYKEESEDTDVLMEAFGITQDLKKENKQYWGRELGMCWQLLVVEIFRNFCTDFSPAKKYGEDEPVDFFVGTSAIDTKYRVGSGDSGTLKKFKQYGQMLKQDGFIPIFLLLRTDNLPAAISASTSSGWLIYTGEDTFQYIYEKTGFDLKKWLINLKETEEYKINR